MTKAKAKTEETEETPVVEMVEIPKKDYEIISRKAALWDLMVATNAANQQSARLQAELQQLSQ